ncbi:MAG: glycoside hydrolase family 16 protein [Ktedonobacteraceae bacterium]|nr:glycoside hydrolase family 16 protein [Ktedonobacteraceae bacterium]
MAWHDEFNGTQLDSSKWFAINSLGDNRYQGCCLDYSYSSLISPNQLRVHDGMLTITTARNTTNGMAYKTGAITTETLSDTPTFTFTYGRIDIRAKLPRGRGVWPAMWLLTSPASAEVSYEIDMMEMLGEDPHTIYMVDHHNNDRQYCDFKGPDYSKGFHVFSFDWKPNKITWYVDGQNLCSTTRSIPNKAMYIIINTALSDGVAWGQAVNSSTPLPQTFDIDYVRVYKHL